MTLISKQMITNTHTLIKVGIVGAGAMGRGIAFQVASHPEMELVWAVDQSIEAAENAIKLAKQGEAGTDFSEILKEKSIDVLVEATNSIGDAAKYCIAAIEAKAHVVLMNAEVDLALRPLLEKKAAEHGVCVTSDVGDQHGVLAVMIEEAVDMGFEVLQAGNVKGFLDRAATPESIAGEAAKRNLSAEQCCAYTDGTKLHIEMAMLANAFGYLPPEGGMTGPRAEHVNEAVNLFDFESYGETPRIDYLLGAEPGGGVYLVVKPLRELPDEQAFYLNYYKLGDGPYYVMYRPYHLCHLETPKAIKMAFSHRGLLPFTKRTSEVYAYAKRALKTGEVLSHAIGSAEAYGLVEPVNSDRVPIALIESSAIVLRDLAPDSPITWDDLELFSSLLLDLWKEQEAEFGNE